MLGIENERRVHGADKRWARGLTVEQVVAAKPTAEYDANVPQAEQTAEQFVRWLYAELKAAR